MTDTCFSCEILNDETIIVDVGIQLDNNNAHEMVKTISAAQSKKYKYIVLDMHRLEFISSAGVGSILGTIESSREIGGDVILCNASSSIMKVLEVLDLVDYLTLRCDLTEAKELCRIEG